MCSLIKSAYYRSTLLNHFCEKCNKKFLIFSNKLIETLKICLTL